MAIEPIIRVIFVLSALVLIGMILLQRGKGADIGASFGSGGAQTLFGAVGGASLLAKATAFLVVLFFTSSFSLAFIAKQRADGAALIDIPTAADYGDNSFPEDFDGDDVSGEAPDSVYDVPVIGGDLAPANNDADRVPEPQP